MSDSDEIKNLSNETGNVNMTVKSLRNQIARLETQNRRLLAILVIGVFLVLFSPGFKIQSDDFFESQLEDARKSVEQETARLFDESGYGYDIMVCVAYDIYSKGTAPPALTRWLEKDHSISGLQEWCLEEPVPEIPFQDP